MNLLRMFCLYGILFNVFASEAQVLDSKIAETLSENERAKIEKADSYINQGNEILFSNFTYPKSKLFQRNPNYIKLSENVLVGKNVSRLLFQTKSYYKAGFEGTIQVLKPYINSYLSKDNGAVHQSVLTLNDSIKGHLESAKMWRDKSKVTANLKSAGKQIHQSNIDYQKAIILAEQAMQIIQSNKSVKRSDLVKDKALAQVIIDQDISEEEPVEEPDLEKVISAKAKPTAPKEALKSEVSTKDAPKPANQLTPEASQMDVYYTIQFLADKKNIPENTIKGLYSGSYPIVVNKGDGWYRYSFGKFKTLVSAKKAMGEAKTKGYVVAYKNEIRISLGEAKLLLD